MPGIAELRIGDMALPCHTDPLISRNGAERGGEGDPADCWNSRFGCG